MSTTRRPGRAQRIAHAAKPSAAAQTRSSMHAGVPHDRRSRRTGRPQTRGSLQVEQRRHEPLVAGRNRRSPQDAFCSCISAQAEMHACPFLRRALQLHHSRYRVPSRLPPALLKMRSRPRHGCRGRLLSTRRRVRASIGKDRLVYATLSAFLATLTVFLGAAAGQLPPRSANRLFLVVGFLASRRRREYPAQTLHGAPCDAPSFRRFLGPKMSSMTAGMIRAQVPMPKIFMCASYSVSVARVSPPTEPPPVSTRHIMPQNRRRACDTDAWFIA